MTPNILETDSSQLSQYINHRYETSEATLMQNLFLKSKHLIIKYSGRQQFLSLYQINDENQCSANHQTVDSRQRADRLLKITEVPPYLQFNPWILRGYRSPNLSTLECLLSLLYVHNETFNILSHTLPLVYCLAFFSSMIRRQTVNALLLSYCHLFGMMSFAFGSSTYHLFMSHRSGAKSYYRLLQCDMIGIWITQSFGALPTIYSSVAAFSLWFRYFFLALYAVLSIVSLKEGLAANSAWKRPASFSLLFLMRVLAFVLRLQTDSARTPYTQWLHITMQELWPLIGAVLSAARIPERFYPGVFDYILNSHNIMHCFVVFGAIHMHMAFVNYEL